MREDGRSMSRDERTRRLRPHPGEYEDPTDNLTVEGQRHRFLTRLAVLRPEVLRDLKGRPLEIYRRIWRDWSNGATTTDPMIGTTMALLIGHLPGWATFKHINPSWSSPSYIEMHNALCHWSEKSHLVDDWIMEAVVETIAIWATDPTAPADGELRFLAWQGMVPLLSSDETRFSFTHPGWQPTTQRWADVRKEIGREFRNSLAAYERRLRDAAEEEGWARVKDTRFRKGDPMDWVITRVIDGEETYEEIGLSAGVSLARTQKAVTELAAQMGLTLLRRDQL